MQENINVVKAECSDLIGPDGYQTGCIRREGTGYGTGISKFANDAHELAIKESETDAMKRAFMTFGYRFGLALYDGTQAHVVDSISAALTKAKSRAVFTDLEKKIHGMSSIEALGSWWKMDGTQGIINTMHPDFVAHLERVKDEAKEKLI